MLHSVTLIENKNNNKKNIIEKLNILTVFLLYYLLSLPFLLLHIFVYCMLNIYIYMIAKKINIDIRVS